MLGRSSQSDAGVSVLDASLSKVRLRSEGMTRVVVGLGGAEELVGRAFAVD